MPNLTYLDTQPVFPNERRLAEAWGKGGQQGEKDERESNYYILSLRDQIGGNGI